MDKLGIGVDLLDTIDTLRRKFADHIRKVPQPLASMDRDVDLIYQYTSLSAVVDMLAVDSGPCPREIWATSAPYMNDTKEFENGRDLFVEILRELRADHNSAGFEGYWQEALTLLEKKAMQVEGQIVFCACYSAKRDDLSQWRGYGAGGRGACLAFDLKAMQTAFPEYSGWVIYDRSEQRRLVMDLVKELAKVAAVMDPQKRSELEQPAEFDPLRRLLAVVFSFLKHPAFQDEAEFRIVYLRHVIDGPVERCFRADGSRILPYVKMTIRNGGETLALPLRSVILAPGARENNNAAALEALLDDRCLREVRVEKSEIPFLPLT